jgi:hypothetical protein
MRDIVIKTQKDLDGYVETSEHTILKIKSNQLVVVKKAWGNSTVEALGNSTVKALGNSTVKALGNSTVKALGNSTVKAWDNSTVKALGNSTVEAWDNSTVKAWGNSTVEALGNSTVKALGNSTVKAWDNSTVEAWDNSTVEALGNSTVKALGNSTVEALGNSTVKALDNSIIKVFSSKVKILKALMESVVIFIGIVESKIDKLSNSATVLVKEKAKHDIESFIEFYDLSVVDNCVTLFKSVNPETLCDFRTGKIKYKGVVNCPDFDDSIERECGSGLHLCATEKLAQSFNKGKTLKCKVNLVDIVVHPYNIQKVRCKKVEVISDNPKRTIVIDGNEIEISEESYKSLKESLIK